MTTSNINPYGLTVTRALRMDSVKTDIAKAAIFDKNNSVIFRITEDHRDVGEFEHPMLFKTPSVDNWRVAIDTRPYRGSSPMVKEQLALLERRAALVVACANKQSAEQLFEPGLLIAYVTILQSILAKQFKLDALTSMHMGIVSAVYYYFITRSDTHEIKDEDFTIIAMQCVKQLRLPADMVESVISRCKPGRSLEDLVNNIKEIEGTDRTIMLSPAVLINACSGLWFGVHKDQMVGILLEHPPTWAAVVYDATGDGTYSRVEMAKRLKSNNLLRQKIPHLHSVVNELANSVVENDSAYAY